MVHGTSAVRIFGGNMHMLCAVSLLQQEQPCLSTLCLLAALPSKASSFECGVFTPRPTALWPSIRTILPLNDGTTDLCDLEACSERYGHDSSQHARK